MQTLDDTRAPHTHISRPRPRRLVWLVVGAGGIAALFAVRAATAASQISLPNVVQDILTLAISVIVESLPFVILGIVLSIAVQVWVPERWIDRVLPRSGPGRRLMISLLGVLLPVCECGNVPLARGLMVRGLTVADSMTFLLAAPILNPITIITTYQAFGWDNGILVGRIAGGLLIANLVGWLFSRHPQQDRLLTSRFAAECRVEPEHGHQHTRTEQSLNLFAREAGVMMPALFIGSLVAGGIQSLVPRQVLVSLGSDPLWSILALMALAFVVSVCSNVDAFFILPFASTFLPGSIVAFLVFGPVIDIKMLALMRTTFAVRTLVILTALVALLSLLVGLVVNLVA